MSQCRLFLAGVAGPCDSGLLRHSSTRQAAGGPLAEDNIKCQLKSVNRRDYPSSMTDTQFEQVRSVFADGVCDWSRRPVGWTPTSQTWLSFGSGAVAAPPVVVPWTLARSAAPAG